jgi:hypothetical protein
MSAAPKGSMPTRAALAARARDHEHVGGRSVLAVKVALALLYDESTKEMLGRQ